MKKKLWGILAVFCLCLSMAATAMAIDVGDEMSQLSVTHTMDSNDPEDQNKVFAYEIALDDRSVDGFWDGVYFLDGVGMVSLAHGESVAIEVKADTYYKVTPFPMPGYKLSSSNTEGWTEANQETTASFTFAPETYSVTLPTGSASGTVQADKTSGIRLGETVKLTVALADGLTPEDIGPCVLDSDDRVIQCAAVPGTTNQYQFTMPASDVTVQLLKTSCEVKWMIDGEVYDTTNCRTGEPVNYVSQPSRANYSAEGWYTEENGSGKKIGSTMIYSAAYGDTFYAYYKPFTKYADIHVDTDGGGELTSIQSIEVGSPISGVETIIRMLVDNGVIAKEGYTYKGIKYYTDENYTTEYNGTVVPAELYVSVQWNTYTVTVSEEITNGTVEASRTKDIFKGDRVSLTIKPDSGFMLDTLSVKCGNNSVEVDANKTFVMPAGNVNVTATFRKIAYSVYNELSIYGTVDKDRAYAGDEVVVEVMLGGILEPEDLVLQIVADREEEEEIEYEAVPGEANQYRFEMPACNVVVRFAPHEVKWMIDGEAYDTTDCYIGKPVDYVSQPSRAGYSAEGWYTEENGGGEKISLTTTYLAEYGDTFYAYYKPFNKYADIHVDTNSDDESVLTSIKYTEVGSPVSDVEAIIHMLTGNGVIVKKGYAYDGVKYYSDKAYTTEYNGTVVPPELYVSVQWKALPTYTVSVQAGLTGGAVTASKTEGVCAGEKVALTVTAAEGYALDTLSVTCGNNSVEVGEDNTFVMPDGDVIVTAAFKAAAQEPDKYQLSVVGGAGSGEYAEGAQAVITADAPEAGYRFKEWTGVEGITFISGGAAAAQSTIEMPARNAVITAVYELIPTVTYTVAFDAGGGTGAMADVTGISGAYILPACGFAAPEGMRFKAWQIGETQYQSGAQIQVEADLTVKALWEADPGLGGAGAPVRGKDAVIVSPAAEQNVTVFAGEQAVMQVAAEHAVYYQWYVDCGDGEGWRICSGDSPVFTLDAAQLSDSGYRYKCVVTGESGRTVESPVFVLTVLELKPAVLPQTGDDSHIGLWLAMCMGGLIGMTALSARARKRNAE